MEQICCCGVQSINYTDMNELTIENLLRFINSKKSHYSVMAGIKGYEKCAKFHECLCILTDDIEAHFTKPKPKEDERTDL